MDSHVRVVAWLYIGFSILGILIGAILFVILIGAGFISQDPEALGILSIIAFSLGSIFVILSVPDIIGGIFLLKKKRLVSQVVKIIFKWLG